MTCITACTIEDAPPDTRRMTSVLTILIFSALLFAGAPTLTAIAEDNQLLSLDRLMTSLQNEQPVHASLLQTEKEEVVVPDEEEILWLARALYSETKISWEQRLVAWVIRNRVESLRYPDTYKNVVLDPKQFSGFNPTDPNYKINTLLEAEDQYLAWQSALAVARDVYGAPDTERILPPNVLHFYSPHAVKNHPKWAVGEPAHVINDPVRGYTRFAFYADIE